MSEKIEKDIQDALICCHKNDLLNDHNYIKNKINELSNQIDHMINITKCDKDRAYLRVMNDFIISLIE